MSLRLEQIENHLGKVKAGTRKWMKNQKARKVRRVKQTEVPNIKYSGWEY